MSLTDTAASNAGAFAVGLVVALGVGYVVLSAVGGGAGQHIDRAEAWCGEYDGDLQQANVVGDHGGLHCVLPNGTDVHMDAVAANDWTHDWSVVEREAVGSDGLGLWPDDALTVGVLLAVPASVLGAAGVTRLRRGWRQ